MRLLKIFTIAVEGGRVPDARIMEYLAECFTRIVDNDDNPEDALNLKKSKGKGKPRDLEVAFRNNTIVEWVDELRNVARVQGKQRMTKEAAFDVIIQELKDWITYDEVERIYNKTKERRRKEEQIKRI